MNPARLLLVILPFALVIMPFAGLRTAGAQDIELTAQMTGRPLPRAYYEQVARQPDLYSFANGWIVRTAAARAAGAAVTGTLPLIVVQALFKDSPEPTITVADVQRVLFDGPATYGTLTASYAEMSRGRLQIAGQVVGWVRSSLTLAEAVGTSQGLGASLGPYLVQALAAVDSTVDFGAFDNDGPDGIPNSGDDDGVVDALAFQYLETAASCGGPGPWPHRSRLSARVGSPYQTNDPRAGGGFIQVDDYIIQSTVQCDGVSLLTATVIAHEMGHVLGLPDLYDASGGINPEQRVWVLGCWSLMAGGGWGCGDAAARTVAKRPPHIGPWEKSQLGWLDEELVVGSVRNGEFPLPPVAASGKVLNVPLSTREYLLIEYRTKTGFDLDLPLPGVLIYHVDLDRPIPRPATGPRLYRVSLLEADGNSGLVRTATEGGNRGEAGDVFGNDPGLRVTNAGTPSTRLNSGGATPVALYGITIGPDSARVRVSTTVIPASVLIGALLGDPTQMPTPEERAYLDEVGNRNGRFDVGDVRRYLREHPTAAAVARP
jgi:M6 family metalloprotease-like protein